MGTRRTGAHGRQALSKVMAVKHKRKVGVSFWTFDALRSVKPKQMEATQRRHNASWRRTLPKLESQSAICQVGNSNRTTLGMFVGGI